MTFFFFHIHETIQVVISTLHNISIIFPHSNLRSKARLSFYRETADWRLSCVTQKVFVIFSEQNGFYKHKINPKTKSTSQSKFDFQGLLLVSLNLLTITQYHLIQVVFSNLLSYIPAFDYLMFFDVKIWKYKSINYLLLNLGGWHLSYGKDSKPN